MPIDFVHMNGDSFEDMCAELFQAEHGAVPIEAKPGDGGIDSFRGSLLNGVSRIWQYKHFPDGIGESQKAQIRKSLKTAVRNYRPKVWTLAVPCDFDTGAQKWFEKQVEEFGKQGTEVNYCGRAELSNLLVRHQPIRQKYFPDTDDKLKVISALLGGRDDVFKEPKANALDLMRAGAVYINSDSPDWAYRVTNDEQGTTVEAFLRNPNAGNATAAHLELAFEPGAVGDKLRRDWADMFRRGTPFEADGANVSIKKSVFDDLIGKDFQLSRVQIVPHVEDRRLPMRLTFTAPSGRTAVLPFVDLRLRHGGTEETTFTNETQDSVITIALSVGMAEGSIQFKTRDYVFRKPSEVLRCEQVLAVIAEGETRLEMEHLESSQSVASVALDNPQTSLEIDEETFAFLQNLETIERSVDPSIRIPKQYLQSDVSKAARLVELLERKTLKVQGSANLDVVVGRGEEARASIAANEPVTVLLERSEEEVRVLGRRYVFDTVTSITAPLVLVTGTLSQVEDGATISVTQQGEVSREYSNPRVVEAPEDDPDI